MTKKEPTIDPVQANTPLPLPQAPVSHLWTPGLARNARRGQDVYCRGYTAENVCLPSRPSSSTGAAQREVGAERAGGHSKKRATIKKRKRVLLQALSYRHLEAGGRVQPF